MVCETLETRVSLPVESNVEVAVPPKYAVSKTEKRVDDAWTNEEAVVEVAVNEGAVIVLYAVAVPRKSELPRVSKIFPVVVVALCPTRTMYEVSDG